MKMINISEKLDLPADVLRNVSRFEVISSDTIYVENHKGVAHFSDTEIHINCIKYTLKIYGYNLEIKTLTDKFTSISGELTNIELSR